MLGDRADLIDDCDPWLALAGHGNSDWGMRFSRGRDGDNHYCATQVVEDIISDD